MFKDILVPVDLNQPKSWGKSLPIAVEMCRDYEANLHVMTVVPDFGFGMVAQFFPPDHEQKMIDEANEKLHGLVKEAVPSDVKVQHIVADGRIYEEVLKAVESLNVDLVVMASHHPDLKDYLLGPNALKVVHHAKCSVMIVRD